MSFVENSTLYIRIRVEKYTFCTESVIKIYNIVVEEEMWKTKNYDAIHNEITLRILLCNWKSIKIE